VSLLQRLTGVKPEREDRPPLASRQPTMVKEWHRRHEDGSIGSVVAWSDGRFVAGHFEYRARAGGVQVGPRYPYRTLAEAFAGSDAEARLHGHLCSQGCALWREVEVPGSTARK
jgi:hypothetical protein